MMWSMRTAAGVAEGLAQLGDEVAVAVVPEAFGMQRREPPVLAAGEERVGRGTAAHAGGEGVPLPPGVEAGGVHAHREVEVEAGAPARLTVASC